MNLSLICSFQWKICKHEANKVDIAIFEVVFFPPKSNYENQQMNVLLFCTYQRLNCVKFIISLLNVVLISGVNWSYRSWRSSWSGRPVVLRRRDHRRRQRVRGQLLAPPGRRPHGASRSKWQGHAYNSKTDIPTSR